jgi:hypothetical protein
VVVVLGIKAVGTVWLKEDIAIESGRGLFLKTMASEEPISQHRRRSSCQE